MSTVVFYIVVAWTASSSLLPARILYDGNAPPLPYRWVVPPRELRQGNQPPEDATGSVPLTAAGSGSGSISTGDAQATVVFPQDAIAQSRGEASVQIRIVPEDPASGSPPPAGLRFDGNVYAVAGFCTLSRRPVTLRKPVSVVLRYPLHATTLLAGTGSQWRALQAETVPSTLQIFATTDALGRFAAAAPIQPPAGSVRAPYVAAGLLLVLAALIFGRRVFATRNPG
jgi:hypothetical protein